MKAKKILTVTSALIMAVTAATPAYAAELTDTSPSGETEVTAQIMGDAGAVTYVISIPDVVDFGVLTQPADDTADDFKTVDYTVTATKIEGLDAATQKVSVYVKDENATVDGDQNFFIANKADSSKKFSYDIFDTKTITATTEPVNNNTMTKSVGFYLHGFTTEGEAVEGSLRINQIQLCGYALSDIVGDYSGHIVFFSTVETV